MYIHINFEDEKFFILNIQHQADSSFEVLESLLSEPACVHTEHSLLGTLGGLISGGEVERQALQGQVLYSK